MKDEPITLLEYVRGYMHIHPDDGEDEATLEINRELGHTIPFQIGATRKCVFMVMDERERKSKES